MCKYFRNFCFAILIVISNCCVGLRSIKYPDNEKKSLTKVYTWKQIGYDYDGFIYKNDTDFFGNEGAVFFNQDIDEKEKFFIQYNNVPIGLEVYKNRIFVTVPRRRYGIPSTLNYIKMSTKTSSPPLKPYPDTLSTRTLVSTYRPRVDVCGRLWVVDTGLLEVPGGRTQVSPPAVVVFDLETDEEIMRYEIKPSDLVNERTSGGLTSLTIDVEKSRCEDAFAYITDLATNGLIVFSLKAQDSWRIQHSSFVREEKAQNFTAAGHLISWQDGIFSLALTNREANGKKRAFYHPLVSTQEFSVGTDVLKNKGQGFDQSYQLLGTRGNDSQSGTHAYHSRTRTLLYANVAKDAILCWNVDTKMTPENIAVITQDQEALVYISDLKISGEDVWVLSNQIPRIIFSKLDKTKNNYFLLRGNVQDLIHGTVCDRRWQHYN